MPSKASRAASRQSKLSRKKRRDRPGPQQTDPGPRSPATVAETTPESDMDESVAVVATPVAEAEADQAPEPAIAQAAARPQSRQGSASRQRPSRRPGRRVAESGEAHVYKHLGAELRQIGMITVVVAAILAALTFVLG